MTSSASADQPAYVHYRASSLGTCLTASLAELIDIGELTTLDGKQALHHFDQAVAAAFADPQLMQTAVHLSGNLSSYRHCDNVWSMLASQLKCTQPNGQLESHQVKIVACEARKFKRKRINQIVFKEA
jgi:transcription initiation factor TFIIA small subunit